MNKESRASRIIVYLGSTTIGTLLDEHAQNGSKKKKKLCYESETEYKYIFYFRFVIMKLWQTKWDKIAPNTSGKY